MPIPLFLVGLTYVWTLMLINFTNETFAIVLGAVALVSFVIFLYLKSDKSLMLVALTVFVACGFFVLKTETYQKPIVSFAGQKLEISGQIISVDGKSSSGANNYTVKVKDGELKGKKVRLTSAYFEGEIDDSVSFTGKLYGIDYLKHKDIFLGCYVFDDVSCEKSDGFSFRKMAFNIRSFVERELVLNLPENESSVLLGMLIGEKSLLSDEVYESFQNVGIVHLLAVSGFHTSLWSMIIYRALLKRGLNVRFASCASVVFILLFIGVTGFAKSTIRAGLMLIVFFFGRIVSRQPDSKNSLGLAALIICLFNPFVGGDIGFLLSFFSTLGILVIYPSLLRVVRVKLKVHIPNFYVRQKVDAVVSIVLVSLSAFVFTLPLVMLFIGNISLISPVSNLFVTTAASASIFLSGVAMLLAKLPILRAFEYPLLLCSGLITKYVLWVTNILEGIPFATYDLGADFVKVSVSATLILIGYAVILKVKTKHIVGVSTVFLVFSILAHYLVEYIETLN